MRVWGIMLAKDEADIIGANLRHHMALGLDGIVVFENMSRDDTGEIARSVPGVLVFEDLEKAFKQDSKNRNMTEIAMANGAEWVIAIDADEFWYPTISKTIPEAVRKLDYDRDCFRALSYHHVCSAFDDPDETNPVLRMRWRSAKCSALKVAHRCGPGTYTWGGNESIIRDGEFVHPRVQPDIRMRHYPVRSLKHLKRKATNGYLAVDDQPGVSRKACGHWRKWYIRYRHGNFASFFNRKFVVDERKLARFPDRWIEDPFFPSA